MTRPAGDLAKSSPRWRLSGCWRLGLGDGREGGRGGGGVPSVTSSARVCGTRASRSQALADLPRPQGSRGSSSRTSSRPRLSRKVVRRPSSSAVRRPSSVRAHRSSPASRPFSRIFCHAPSGSCAAYPSCVTPLPAPRRRRGLPRAPRNAGLSAEAGVDCPPRERAPEMAPAAQCDGELSPRRDESGIKCAYMGDHVTGLGDDNNVMHPDTSPVRVQ